MATPPIEFDMTFEFKEGYKLPKDIRDAFDETYIYQIKEQANVLLMIINTY